MLIQLHWQNRSDTTQTEFVAQFDDAGNPDGAAMDAWAREIIARRGHEMPDGWVPMLCNERAPEFVWAVPDSIVSVEK